MSRHRARSGLLALVLCTGVAGLGAEAQAAKKGGGKAATEQAANVAIADAIPGAAGLTEVPFAIGKKFKGKRAGKVEITTQVTGSEPDYLNTVFMRLISPQGRAVGLVAPPSAVFAPDQAYGPMKETPDSPAFACFFIEECGTQGAIGPPFAGTVGNIGLSWFYRARMRGTWILQIGDFEPGDGTGVLNGATLRVKPAKPIE